MSFAGSCAPFLVECDDDVGEFWVFHDNKLVEKVDEVLGGDTISGVANSSDLGAHIGGELSDVVDMLTQVKLFNA
jgi:hypothetical protein